MSQSTLSIANGTGAAVRAALNTALQAQATNQSGSSAPSTTYAYQFWADTTTGTLKIRNGANNAWVALYQLDGTITIEDGSAASPGLALRTDLDCGFYKAGTNSIGISTAGTARLTISSTGVVTIPGDLTVQGTTTTIDSTTLRVADKNIEMGNVSGSPSDLTADGGGITLLGTTSKTFNWVDSTDAWTSSEHIHLGDSKKLLLGASSDLYLYHDGSSVGYINNTTGQLKIQSDNSITFSDSGNNEDFAKFNDNAACQFFYDGGTNPKLETTSNGIKLIDANDPHATLTSTPVQLILDNKSNHSWDENEHCGAIIFKKGFADGSNTSNIVAAITATHTRPGSSHTNEDGGIQIWTSPNANPTAPAQTWEFEHLGHFRGRDDNKVRLGDANDLELYHESSSGNSYITNNNGNLYIDGDANDLVLQAGDDIRIQTQGNENSIECIGNEGVKLYYDDSTDPKLQTTSTGSKVTGKLEVTGGIQMHASQYIYGDSGIDFYGDGGDAGSKLVTLVDGGFKIKDDNKINFGSSDDLQVFHQASNNVSYIQQTVAAQHLIIKNTSASATGSIYIEPRSGESAAKFDGATGECSLRYGGIEKFKTTEDGITIIGDSNTEKLITLYGTTVRNNYIGIIGGDNLEIAADEGADGGSSSIRFRVDATEKVRVTSDGLSIGSTTVSYPLTVKGIAKHEATNSTNGWLAYTHTDNTYRLNYNGAGNDEIVLSSGGNMMIEGNALTTPGVLEVRSTGGSNNQVFISCHYNQTTEAGGIRRNGTAQEVEFYNGSDKRLKKDIADMPAVLSKLNQIKLKTYKYKNDDSAFGLGPIAQDLVEIFPEKVVRTDDGTGDNIPDGVKPWTIGTNFTWQLIKAVQELSIEIETLKTKVAALETG